MRIFMRYESAGAESRAPEFKMVAPTAGVTRPLEILFMD